MFFSAIKRSGKIRVGKGQLDLASRRWCDLGEKSSNREIEAKATLQSN